MQSTANKLNIPHHRPMLATNLPSSTPMASDAQRRKAIAILVTIFSSGRFRAITASQEKKLAVSEILILRTEAYQGLPKRSDGPFSFDKVPTGTIARMAQNGDFVSIAVLGRLGKPNCVLIIDLICCLHCTRCHTGLPH